ncbi:MAG: cation diffusion facilitator family transporter [Ectothiorhodospiraceae bacterium]|jgi:cation diffusion facilitator family transporter
MGRRHHSGQSDSPADEREQKTRITLIGAAANLLLAALKVVIGFIGQSQALIVDGIHSLSDLVSDGLVLFAAHAGSKDADDNHPYGHGRFETAATVAIGVVLLMVAGGFAYDAVLRLLRPENLWVPHWIVLPAAVASVLAKEVLYRYTARVGRRCRSQLIEANAWHHRSDALSSLVVIGGFAGTLAGFPWFDAVAAIIVAGMVGTMGWQFAWQSVQELVDTGLDPNTVEELADVVNSVEGVRSHHNLRTRFMAGEVLIDVHILVDPLVSVSEGHRIGEAVHDRLSEHLDRAGEVLVHVDAERLETPEDRRPPLRTRILSDLEDAWKDIPEAALARRITLHYRNDKVDAELLLTADTLAPDQLGPLGTRLEKAAGGLNYLRDVRVLLTPA